MRRTAASARRLASIPAEASAASRFHSAVKAATNSATSAGCIRRLPGASSTAASSLLRRTRARLMQPAAWRTAALQAR